MQPASLQSVDRQTRNVRVRIVKMHEECNENGIGKLETTDQDSIIRPELPVALRPKHEPLCHAALPLRPLARSCR
jgi:hypothetical protein